MPPRSSHRAKTLFQGLLAKLYGGGYEQGGNSESGSLTVTARVSGNASRYAMPSPNVSDFVYAALLYEDGKSPESPQQKDFAEGEANGDKFVFSFQRPDKTSGLTLEVFAFKSGTTDFSTENALLSGTKEGLKVKDDAIEVSDIALSVHALSKEKGTVSLQIKVPDDCSLEIKELKSDGTVESTPHFAITGASPDFTVTQVGEGISAGAYSVTFTVKKDVNGEFLYVFNESINVLPGMRTDTWWNGAGSSATKEITQGMISSTVYVRGTGGWYDDSPYSGTATASDDNSGSFLSPLATIQKAVNTVIARNSGTGAYTICVDGTLACNDDTYIGTHGMADFSALDKNLTLTMKALSGTATLDGGARFDGDGNVLNTGIEKRVIYALPASGKLSLTLENLTIKGGNTSGNGGGIFFGSTGSTLTISHGTAISGNKANKGGGVYVYGGTFTMTGGEISGNEASEAGGVYVCGGTFTMSDGKIRGNMSEGMGGGVYLSLTTLGTTKFNMDGGEIDGNNAASDGGGVCVYGGQFKMTKGTISGNTATGRGGGVIVTNGGTFYMSGSASIPAGEDGKNDVWLYNGGKVIVAGDLTAAIPVATITPYKYEADRQVLSAYDETTMQDNYSKFVVTPQANDDGTETKWKIVADAQKGVLKKDEVSTGGDGISVVLPGQGTYTFKLEAGGTEIVEGSTLQSGANITLSEVRKDGVALTESDGTFTIEIREGGSTLASATGFQCAVEVPTLPPIGMAMQIYVKVVLTSGIVIDKKIAVTGP